MNFMDFHDTFTHFKQMEHDYIGYQSLTDVPRVFNVNEELQSYEVSLKTYLYQWCRKIIYFCSISTTNHCMTYSMR